MSQVTFPEFAQACQVNGIAINAGLLAQPYVPRPSYQPGEWYGAVAAAGDMLRQNPDLQLADQAIPEDFVGESPTVAQMTLRGVMNASQEQVTGLPLGRTFQCSNASWTYNCSAAEGAFADTLQVMDTVANGGRAKHESGWTIVADKEEAIGVLKMGGERLMVSLFDVAVNGIRYPYGSLFTAKAVRPIRKHQGDRVVVPSEEIGNIGFMRLSAYALPVGSRCVFNEGRQPGRTNTPEQWPIKRMRHVAQQAINCSRRV